MNNWGRSCFSTGTRGTRNRTDFSTCQDSWVSSVEKPNNRRFDRQKKNVQATAVEPKHLKDSTCPKCCLFYDIKCVNNGNAYIGRLPLILSCGHTICEECIRSSIPKKEVVCGECHTRINLTVIEPKKNIQDLFPINFYVFGSIVYYRKGMSNSNFKSSGQTANLQTEEQGSTSSVKSFKLVKECSQDKCDKDATIYCSECDENFCTVCATILHKSAKGLMKHKLGELTSASPEISKLCPDHKGSVVEFFCDNCQQNLCCYCILSNHKDHNYSQLSVLNAFDLPKISLLICKGEDMLAKLQKTDKKIVKHLKNDRTTKSDKFEKINKTIRRYFENLHATIQVLEKRLQEEVDDYQKANARSLMTIREGILENISSLETLVRLAKKIVNKENEKKLNVNMVIENLTAAIEGKCHLMYNEHHEDIAFETGNILTEIHDNIKIRCGKTGNFTLVGSDELPDDYVDETMSETSSVSQLSSTITDTNLTDILRQPSLSQANRNDSIENWLKLSPASSTSSRIIDVEVTPLKIGDKEQVKVSHINSPDSFFVQLTKYSNFLVKLNKHIASVIKTGVCCQVEPQLTEIYLAKYKSRWYRCRVKDIADNLYTLFFIDYGNTSVVGKTEIKSIPKELLEIPPLTIECKICRLYPKSSTWCKGSVSLFADIVNGNDIIMVIVDISLALYEVDLITADGTSVKDALTFTGFGIRNLDEENRDIAQIQKSIIRFDTTEIYKFTKSFNKLDSANVIISHVTDPYHVYLNLADRKSTLTDLQTKMDAFYGENKKGFVYSPRTGMVVAVSVDSNWNRGKIVEVNDGRGMLKVHLVDVGRTVLVQWMKIRKLNEQFVKHECQAFKVQLAHVEPLRESWKADVKEIHRFFEEYVREGKVLKMVVENVDGDDVREVALFDCQQTLHFCLNAMLVRNNLAKATGTIGETLEWPQVDKSDPDHSFTLNMMRTVQTNKESGADDTDDEDGYSQLLRKEVDIAKIENPDTIYVHFKHLKKEFEKMDRQLQEYDSNSDFVDSEWSAGDMCVVLHENHFYRGCILGSNEGSAFNVNLIDVPKDVVATPDKMVQLDANFRTLPNYAVKCHLANVTPAGGSDRWSSTACDFLVDSLKGKKMFMVTKCGVVDLEKKSIPVIMWYTDVVGGGPLEPARHISHSVNNLLIRNGLALKKPNRVKPPVNKFSFESILPSNSTLPLDSALPSNSTSPSSDLTSSTRKVKTILIPTKIVQRLKSKGGVSNKVIKEYLPPEPFKSPRFSAIVTYIDNIGAVYLHDADDEVRLTSINDALNERFKDSSPNLVINWKPGDLCTAKYFVTESWYRAKVVDVAEDKVKVVMVDYGNEENCDRADLRDEVLCHDVPVFANKITLENVYPKDGVWQTSDLDAIHSALVEKKVDVLLRDFDTSEAVVFVDGVNINKYLVEHMPHLIGHSYCNDDDDAVSNSSSTDVIICDADKEEPECGFRLFYEVPISNESYINIVLINILKYNKVVFESSDEVNEEYKSLFREIADDISSSGHCQRVAKNVTEGMACIALYTDNMYYRAKVLEVHDDESVLVLFVDYGNVETVKMEQVKEIKNEWLALPVLQYIATVVGIELTGKGDEDEIKELMNGLYEEKLKAIISSEDPLEVKLFKYEESILVSAYENIIDRGLLKETN